MTMQYYIAFPAGSIAGARSNNVMTNPPVGSGITVAWTPANNDLVASNYTLNSDLKTVSYNPPAPTLNTQPNPSKFAADVMADVSIPTTTKVYLAPYMAVMGSYNSQTSVAIKALWAAITQEFSQTSWMTPANKILIQNHAASNNMPLI